MMSTRKRARGPRTGASSSRFSTSLSLHSSSCWLRRTVAEGGASACSELARRCVQSDRSDTSPHRPPSHACAEVRVARDARGRRPAELGHRRGARPAHPRDALLGADVLGPDVALHADHVLPLVGRQHLARDPPGVPPPASRRAREGSRTVHVRSVTTRPRPAARWPTALAVVEIQRRPGREHGVVTGLRRGACAINAAPRHHGGLGREAAFENLVPADQPAAVCGQEATDPLHEVALQRRLVWSRRARACAPARVATRATGPSRPRRHPTWMYGPGNSSSTSRSTFSRNANVDSSTLNRLG